MPGNRVRSESCSWETSFLERDSNGSSRPRGRCKPIRSLSTSWGAWTWTGGTPRGVRRQVEACGLADRVHFHGSLGGELLEERFRQAQLFVVPSSYEGFGIVYLEAMGFGLPVIGTASGATDEIVLHESTGYLVPPGDATILARRIESFLEDRDLLARMSLQAFEAFADHPGWDESTGQIEELLVALTSKTRLPSAPTRAR